MPWRQQGGRPGGADGMCVSAFCVTSFVRGQLWCVGLDVDPRMCARVGGCLACHVVGACSCGGAGLGDMPVLCRVLDGKGEPGLRLIWLGRV